MEGTEAHANIENAATVPFYRIVLTGGPCGGKTTAMARLSNYLRERGFEVALVPETFGVLVTNGMSLDYFSTEGMDVVIQGTVVEVQEAMEDGLEKVLKARGKPAVLLCDRGLMDSAAYMSKEKFEFIMESRHKQVPEFREGRYNAVFHMVTAADGAEKFYSLENNQVRTESVDVAIEVDQKTQNAWVGHPHLHIIDNSTGFEGKLQRLVERVARLVGLPTNLSRASAKFLLKGPPDLSKFTCDYQMFEVEKVYLVSRTPQTHESFLDSFSNLPLQDECVFVRKRSNLDKDGNKMGGSVYGMTTVQTTFDGKRLEKKRIMSVREYNSSLKQRDLTRHVVRQKRIAFLYKLQSFNIHIYEEPIKELCILHAQVEVEDESQTLQVDVPEFLEVECRIQNTSEDEGKYGSQGISVIQK